MSGSLAPWPVDDALLARTPGVALRRGTAAEVAIAKAIDDDTMPVFADAGLSFDVEGHAAFFDAEARTWTDAARGGRLVLACDDDGEVLGFAALGLLDDAPILEQLSVRRSAMRRGIGSTLVTCAIAWSARAGALWLTTYAHLPWNQPFYERRGFRVVEERRWGPGIAALVAAERAALPRPDARVVMRYVHD